MGYWSRRRGWTPIGLSAFTLNHSCRLAFPRGITSMSQHYRSNQFRATRDYQEIKERALQIRELFRRHNIQFHTTSAIGVLLKDAEILADNFSAGQSGTSDFQILLNAAHLDRMADALLLLEGEPSCKVYLNKLTSKSLNFLGRTPSQAKDTYWEIELWALLKGNFPNVRLVDPPDIILDTPDGPLAIACKKIYSKKNVARQLSSAVKQLEKFDGMGIAAINIDDLVPEEVLLRSRSTAEMLRFIDAENIRFLSTCQRPIQKYFENGRLSAVAICTNLLAEITHDGTRFNNARQMTVWAWPHVPPPVSNRLKSFATAIGVQIKPVAM